MRRALAFLLAALFSFELIGPVLSASAAPELPACCRRNGKHHCAMANMGEPSAMPADPSVKTLQPRCPFFPKVDVVPGCSIILVFGVLPVVGAPNLLGWTTVAPEDHRSLAALRGPVRKRGPPPSLA